MTTDDLEPPTAPRPASWPFRLWERPEEFDEVAFLRLFEANRRFLAAEAWARATPDELRELTASLEQWSGRLEARAVPDHEAPYGQLHDVPTRGLGFMPRVTLLRDDGDVVRAEVEYSRWHVGGGGAVHGGFVSLVLDELLGRLPVNRGRVCRTAYLNVTYVALTPFDEPLLVDARITRVEGRKHFLEGTISRDGAVCARADALFVAVADYPSRP